MPPRDTTLLSHDGEPATIGPDAGVRFDIREIPFSRRGSWLNLSPVIAAHTTTGDRAPRLAPQRLPRGPRAAAGGRWCAGGHHVVRGSRDLPLGVGGRVRRGGLRGPRRHPPARHRAGPASHGCRERPHPVQRCLTSSWTRVDSALVFTVYETGRRYRVSVLSGAWAVEGCESLGASTRSVLLGSDGASLGGRDSRGDLAAEHALLHLDVRRGRGRQCGRLRLLPRGHRLLARPEHPGSGPRRVRAVVGDGRAKRFRHPRVRADVEALDGQGVELGPLLQRPGACSWSHRRGRSTSSWRPSTTRTSPAPCRTRSPIPRFCTTTSSRRSTGGRYGGSGPPRPAISTVERARADPRRPGPMEPVLARLAPASRARAAVLPARQRQRLGQRDDLRRRPRHRVARPRRLPGAPARRPGRPRPTSSAARSTGWRESGDLLVRALLDQLWTGTTSSRSAPCPAARAPQQACSTCCPSFSATGFRSTSAIGHGGSARRTTSPRTASPPSRCPQRTTRPTATGAARSGHRPQPSSRTACDAAGSSPSPTRSAPVSASCANAPASPRTSTPVPVRASGPRLHVDRCGLPPLGRGSRPPNELTAGVQKRHRSGS